MFKFMVFFFFLDLEFVLFLLYGVNLVVGFGLLSLLLGNIINRRLFLFMLFFYYIGVLFN